MDGGRRMSKDISRPVLRWHGGKWLLAPWIIKHFPRHRIYTEVFGGAASVLIRKPISHSEVYNDLDMDVVNLFQVLRDSSSAEKLREMLRLTPFARQEFKMSYETTDDPIERARRLIIVSFMGFGSNAHNTAMKTGFRADSSRSGTTPARDWANYPECLDSIIQRLRGVIIESRHAFDVLKQHDSDETLHYVDPPYVHSTRGSGGAQRDYRYEMTDADHRNLAEVLRSIRGGVVLSGYPCPLYDELYQDWHREARKALADGARERTEILWMNDWVNDRLAQGSLF